MHETSMMKRQSNQCFNVQYESFVLDRCSLLGGMMPMPRILYAIAKDGLIFRFLAYVNPRFQTPVVATVLSGFAAGSVSFIHIMFPPCQCHAMFDYRSTSVHSLWPGNAGWHDVYRNPYGLLFSSALCPRLTVNYCDLTSPLRSNYMWTWWMNCTVN